MFSKFFRRNTVASLTSSMTKTVNALNALADAERDRAISLFNQATALEQDGHAANREALLAATVAHKVGALLD